MYKRKLFLLIPFLVFVISCSKIQDIELTDEQRMIQKLESGTWKMANVHVDGIDQSSLFRGFSIDFSASTYTTTGKTPVWSNAGTWKFNTNTSGTEFTREDNINVTIRDITDSSLVLALVWKEGSFNGGRFESVAGKHVFNFIK